MMPKKETWYIRLLELNVGPNAFQAVQGSRVSIPGYEEFDFFAHGHSGDWTITDGRTGCSIVSGKVRQKDAIVFAKARLDAMAGPEKYGEVIATKEQKDGVSPRYREEVTS